MFDKHKNTTTQTNKQYTITQQCFIHSNKTYKRTINKTKI